LQKDSKFLQMEMLVQAILI